VILLARSEPELAALASGVRARGGSAEYIVCDVRDTTAASDAGKRILAGGVPDVIVSNAGHSIHRYVVDYADRFHDISRTAGVNYLGPVALLLELLPHMHRGKLVNVSSVSVAIPAPGWSAYGASKGAFDAWVRAVAPELALQGVATTSMRLPLVHSEMSSAWRGMPGLSVASAAALVSRGIVTRQRLIAPWWVRLLGGAMEAAPKTSDRVLTWYARRERGTRS
jgi:NAD(P)-dependent dehydrogenase (short-subunit alcohol dehydrogenase family)